VLTLAEPLSEGVAIAQAGVRRAEGEQIRARSGELPQLSLQASYDRALASEFEGVFDFDSGPGCSPFALNPAAPIDARVAEIERAIDCGAVGGGGFFGSSGDNGNLNDLPFGRKNTFRLLLNFSQNLYSGGRNGAQKEVAALGHESAGHVLTTARGQLLYEVAQAYYDAVLSDRLVAIAAATLEQAGATLKQTQAGFDAGTQPEFEVLRARVSRDNQSPVLIRQRANCPPTIHWSWPTRCLTRRCRHRRRSRNASSRWRRRSAMRRRQTPCSKPTWRCLNELRWKKPRRRSVFARRR
jgi:hypothetical protein